MIRYVMFKHFKKMSSQQETRRKRVYEIYFDHFKAETILRATISDIIKSAKNDSGHERVR